MIIGVIIGLLVWLVVPLFFASGKGRGRRKRQRIIALTCKIIGIVIICYAVLQYINIL